MSISFHTEAYCYNHWATEPGWLIWNPFSRPEIEMGILSIEVTMKSFFSIKVRSIEIVPRYISFSNLYSVDSIKNTSQIRQMLANLPGFVMIHLDLDCFDFMTELWLLIWQPYGSSSSLWGWRKVKQIFYLIWVLPLSSPKSHHTWWHLSPNLPTLDDQALQLSKRVSEDRGHIQMNLWSVFCCTFSSIFMLEGFWGYNPSNYGQWCKCKGNKCSYS